MREDKFEFGYVELTIGHPEIGAWVLAEDGVLSIITHYGV